jgi:hypothetical protein
MFQNSLRGLGNTPITLRDTLVALQIAQVGQLPGIVKSRAAHGKLLAMRCIYRNGRRLAAPLIEAATKIESGGRSNGKRSCRIVAWLRSRTRTRRKVRIQIWLVQERVVQHSSLIVRGDECDHPLFPKSRLCRDNHKSRDYGLQVCGCPGDR